MRDKVKRFLSILMTALMLVNLLPVGGWRKGSRLVIRCRAERVKRKPCKRIKGTFMCMQGFRMRLMNRRKNGN